MVAFFFVKPGDVRLRFFYVTAIVMFVYLTFNPFLYLLFIRHIPVLKGLVGVSRRFFMIGEFSMLVVLGFVLQRWLELSEENRRRVASLARGFALVSVIFISSLVCLKIIIAVFHRLIAEKVVLNLKAVTNPSIFITDVHVFSH